MFRRDYYVKEQLNQMENSTQIITKDLAETDEFVIVQFTEVIDGRLSVSFEKGIKDADGDIIRFEKI